MKKFTTIVFAALLFSSVAFPVNAEASYYDRDARKQLRDFFDCAFTPAAHFPGTIAEAASKTPELSTLFNLVVAAGLGDVLSGPGPFTVFAPTNAAFDKIPGPVLGAIGGDLGLLSAVLTYHVVPGKRSKNDPRRVFNRISQVKTVQGQSLFFSRDKEGTEINQSNLVSCQPVRTTNGIVFLIDSVMLPQF